MNIAIIGSAPRKDGSRNGFPVEKRHWVGQLVQALHFKTRGHAVIVSGGADGPDTWAVEAARQLNMSVEVLDADWKRYGKQAGPMRNSQIAATCHALVAFWDCESKGTHDCFLKAIKLNKCVFIVGPTAEFEADRVATMIVNSKHLI